MSVFDLKLLLSLSILFMAADEAGCGAVGSVA